MSDADVRQRAGFRYGAVFVLMVALLVFVIVAPSGDLTRAVVLALEGAALLVVVATSRERRAVRNARVRVLAVAGPLLVAAVAFGACPLDVVLATNGALTLGHPGRPHRRPPAARADPGRDAPGRRGRADDLRPRRPDLRVARELRRATSTRRAYFAQGGDGTQGDRVYFSFTVLTTTGFGDFTAATPVGHALAVVEMLLGQLYLVTVIGVAVGSFAGRSRS